MSREELIGKSVIGVVKVFDEQMNLKKAVELIGQIVDINDEKGIVVANHESKTCISIPMEFDAFTPAKKGYYTMHSGKTVKDPDVMCNMVLQEKQN